LKKTVVIGSRKFGMCRKQSAQRSLLCDCCPEAAAEYSRLCRALDDREPFIVVSGGASGADSLAALYAKERSYPITIFRPDWARGRGAGFARNVAMVDDGDDVVAFWDGNSRGTRHTINYARKQGKPVEVQLFSLTSDFPFGSFKIHV
jgi:hypothetical protein